MQYMSSKYNSIFLEMTMQTIGTQIAWTNSNKRGYISLWTRYYEIILRAMISYLSNNNQQIFIAHK